ncbi:hypothetical protein [Streptomyces sp. CC228A]|uniref:hypothetical protein n=1 Tax=Streptomyces sp. CC228A TaxID=2898186 RepID=UPI0035A8BEB7
MSTQLPPVAPGVTAELVAALPPRLRKRLDTGVAKLAARPAVRDGDTVRIAVDDATELVLHAPGGTVTSAAAIRCGCLLAPDCLHRAAAASAAPIALEEEPPGPAPEAPPHRRHRPRKSRPYRSREHRPDRLPASRRGRHPRKDPRRGPRHGRLLRFLRLTGPRLPGTRRTGPVRRLRGAVPRGGRRPGSRNRRSRRRAPGGTAARRARSAPRRTARAAAAAVSAVGRVRAARAADPAYRLADLATDLRHLLLTSWRIPRATGPELATLRGTARQTYAADGSLRLYGLFSEPVLTAGGHAGAVTWTADPRGRRYTVADIAPGGPARATGAADRAVRMGDTALTHRELSRAGLAVSGATVSPAGRLGAGAGSARCGPRAPPGTTSPWTGCGPCLPPSRPTGRCPAATTCCSSTSP